MHVTYFMCRRRELLSFRSSRADDAIAEAGLSHIFLHRDLDLHPECIRSYEVSHTRMVVAAYSYQQDALYHLVPRHQCRTHGEARA